MILLANSKSGERRYKKGFFSPLGGEQEPPFVLEKNRTSLQKSNSPTESYNDAPPLIFGWSVIYFIGVLLDGREIGDKI
jgi:hypothetical protein